MAATAGFWQGRRSLSEQVEQQRSRLAKYSFLEQAARRAVSWVAHEQYRYDLNKALADLKTLGRKG
jgi:hypothetical protein